MQTHPQPHWRPSVVPTIEWTIEEVRKHLSRKQLAIFENGTFVVWQGLAPFSGDGCKEMLLAVAASRPDFKVRRSASGDFLVTFRGGVGGLVPGDVLRDNFSMLREAALSEGRFESELFAVDDAADGDDELLVAGLYVRARLFLDARHPLIVHVSP